jgi:DNA-binding NtrC family response regulator
MRILVVDPHENDRMDLTDRLAPEGHELATASNGREALDRVEQESFDLILADVKIANIDGIELVRRIKNGPHAATVVVLMSSNGTIPLAVQAVKLGAFDFVSKPLANGQLFPLLDRVQRQRQKTLPEPPGDKAQVEADINRTIIGDSESMQRVKRMIRISARTEANVLVVGETGVGKDLIASAIHRNSHRRNGPCVKVGCTLFPSTLIESELYGHEEGSFTGASQPRKGRFELADGGTIYLDDVDDIPLEHQAKLLRAIEEKVFERVGGNKLMTANVRIVASTKTNLLSKIGEGTFRQDLYYRLDVLRIHVPPLRERREDIPALVEHLLERIATDARYRLDPEAAALLAKHDWPGNVRELYHTLERIYLIGSGHISAELAEAEMEWQSAEQPDAGLVDLQHPGGFRAAMQHAEKQLLLNALDSHRGNKTAAASSLGMKPSTFRDKLAKYGLP